MSITREAWLKALEDANVAPEEDDQDAITILEFAEMFGMTPSSSRRRLTALERAGKATRARKRGATNDGRVVSYTAWRLAE